MADPKIDMAKADKHLDKACEHEVSMVQEPGKADDYKRKANLFFKSAMAASGTSMGQGEKVLP